MTTKSEFYNFISGFRMGMRGANMVSMTDFNEILSMMEEVIDTEIAAAKPKAEPIGVQAQMQVTPVEDDAADNVPAMAEHAPIIMSDSLTTDAPPAELTPEQQAANMADGIDPTVDVMAPANNYQ